MRCIEQAYAFRNINWLYSAFLYIYVRLESMNALGSIRLTAYAKRVYIFKEYRRR